MRKVLIVSYYFPPLNNMASKRYGYMCKYFAENGYEPMVLTTHARYGAHLDSKLDLKVPIDEKNIIRIGMMGVRYPIKKFGINILLDWMNHNNKKSRIVESDSLGWYFKVIESQELETLKDIDIVIGTFPSIGNIFVANYIAQRLHVPYVAEIRDLISDYEESYNRNAYDKKIEVLLEKSLLFNAKGIISVTSGFEKLLKARYPKKLITTVYNGWVEKEFVNKAESSEEDYLYYAGGLYEHRVESLELLIGILKEENIRIKVIIRSIGPKRLTERLKIYIKDVGMEQQVFVKDAAVEKVVQEEQENARINLLISSIHKEDTALMTTLPGKLFELINVDKPVLAITDKSSEIGYILKNTNKGIASSSKTEICAFIRSDYSKYVGNGEEKNYSREKQAIRLCAFLDKVLAEG